MIRKPRKNRRFTLATFVNGAGRRVGESHHAARLTNHEVELMRQLREDGHLSYATLALKFETTKGHARDIVTYRRRNQTGVRRVMRGRR